MDWAGFVEISCHPLTYKYLDNFEDIFSRSGTCIPCIPARYVGGPMVAPAIPLTSLPYLEPRLPRKKVNLGPAKPGETHVCPPNLLILPAAFPVSLSLLLLLHMSSVYCTVS
jgi:hypothetical protein